MLDPEAIERADLSTTALLTVLVERITRLRAANTSYDEVMTAHAAANRVAVNYNAEATRLTVLRDDARREAESWRAKVRTAKRHGADDLADQARERVAMWARHERDADEALAECAKGQQRLAEAIHELEQLAARARRR